MDRTSRPLRLRPMPPAALVCILVLVSVAEAGTPPAHRAVSAPRPGHRSRVAARSVSRPPTVTIARSESATPGAAGMRIAIDPETGALVAPEPDAPAVTRAEAAGLDRSFAGLRQVVRPDGSVMVDLQGRFQEYAVVRVDASGRLRFGCVESARDARHFIDLCDDHGAPAPPEE